MRPIKLIHFFQKGFLVAVITTLLVVGVSYASEKVLTVSPSIARIDLDVDPPEFLLYYKNTTDSTIDLTFSAQDFKELEEGGRIEFLQEKDAKNYHYSLSSWISLEKKSFTLTPGEETQLKVFIDKDKLTPGGHYATILAQIGQKTNRGQIQLQGNLSTLVFVRTSTGKEIEKGAVASFQSKEHILTLPQAFSFRFHNNGNVDLEPHGTIEIQDKNGEIVAKGIVNESSSITLPESIRKYEVKMGLPYHFVLPGVYHAKLSLHFGKKDRTIQETLSFTTTGTIPPQVALLIVGVLLILFLLRKRLYGLFKTKS